MKLDDPRLEALVDAYRQQQRPSSAQRAAMLARFQAAQRPWFVRWPVVTGVSAAAAAAVVAWLAVGGPSTPSREGSERSGMQAPRDAKAAEAEAVHERGDEGVEDRDAAPPPEDATDATTLGRSPEPASDGTASERARPTGATKPRTSAEPTVEPSPSPSVDEEVRLIEAAEAALRANRPERALDLLDRHQREYPHATTVEERQALRILALCAQGRLAEGRGARFSFLRDHPQSAYRTRIDKACPRP